MATIFVSPGVYTKEQDFSVFASRIGITRLGLVGKTTKGPAFEVTSVSSTDEFSLRFGNTHPDYPLTYVANTFLAQSNELTVTRVLGLEGFTNSNAWLITADGSNTYDISQITSGATFAVNDFSASTDYELTFTEAVAGTMVNNTLTASTLGGNGLDMTISYSGLTMETLVTALNLDVNFAAQSWWTATGGDTTAVEDFTVSGASIGTEAKGIYSGSTLAILRSKQNPTTSAFYYSAATDIEIGNISTTTTGDFVISATTGVLTANTYTVSLDETSDNYITKFFGKSPKYIAGTPNLYVERIYPHFVREAQSRSQIVRLASSMTFKSDDAYTSFGDEYTYAETPWIVSRVIGSEVNNLFKVRTLSDGNAANTEIKASIQNIDIVNYTFTLVVRRFSDTDATASSTALETFSNLTMDDTKSNFIGKVIGTYDEEYPRKSMFVTIELAEAYPADTVPAGFRGYTLRGDSTGTDSKAPNLYYKTEYLSGDSIYKTYLGVSELGYSSLTTNQVSVRNSVQTLESDLFQYIGGYTTSATTDVKGFHMENTADSTAFISGNKASLSAYLKASIISSDVVDKNQLKFTVVPTGGFDGWNKYAYYTETYAQFTDTQTSNVTAFKSAIDTFANPEEVDINLFATPGVDFSNNETIIKYALTTMEDRTDTLYIMDSPRVTDSTDKGTPEEVVQSLESTGIDSNYACTYWPWIQIEDSISGKYTYQPPTMLVAKAIAYTDNIASPWFAPAGLNRGLAGTSVKRTDIKLNKDGRNTLYEGRVNPIAFFIQQGISIWGQKTLQINQSSLDRINIRRLLLQVRRLVAAASITLVFEQNDQTLRDQFLSRVEPLLLQIQNQRGLTAFKVMMDATNNTDDTIDRNMLIGKIQLQPTRTAEFIDLTFQVLPSGASFEDF